MGHLEETVAVQPAPAPAPPVRVVVPLHGELDIATADAMADYALSYARPGALLVLDLSRVTFCDCSGLTALLRLAREVRAGGSDLALAAPSPMIRQLLSLTDLLQVLPVLPSSAA